MEINMKGIADNGFDGKSGDKANCNWEGKLKSKINGLLELIYPSNIYCICCGNLIDETRPYALCDQCLEQIRWANERTCAVCGKVMADDNPDDVCRHCQGTDHFFDKGYTCMVYGQREKEMVHKFKFNGKAYMGEKLGQILLDRIKQAMEESRYADADAQAEAMYADEEAGSLDFDLVTAVPMHPKKLKRRGYNQAELMAKIVAKGLGIEYNSRVLTRKYYNNPMNKLGAEQRHKNLVGAYGRGDCEPSVLNGKRVLLIDDVYTTGSTADECSRLLKEQGADKVYVLTLAAGVGD